MHTHKQKSKARIVSREICRVIGIPIEVGSIKSISENIFHRISDPENRGGYICAANVHMLSVAHENPKFKVVMENATLTIADGMPLVWTQKVKGHNQAERVCGPDLMIELCRLSSDANKSIYLLGSEWATLALLSQKLKSQFPKLMIAGIHAPAILPEEPPLDLKLAKEINDSGASLLFVGLGCPKQEFWCATYSPHLKPLTLGVGAAFDFHAGTKTRPSLFVQKFGFEWLHRLLTEPRRLGGRYVTSNNRFLYLSLKELLTNTLNCR